MGRHRLPALAGDRGATWTQIPTFVEMGLTDPAREGTILMRPGSSSHLGASLFHGLPVNSIFTNPLFKASGKAGERLCVTSLWLQGGTQAPFPAEQGAIGSVSPKKSAKPLRETTPPRGTGPHPSSSFLSFLPICVHGKLRWGLRMVSPSAILGNPRLGAAITSGAGAWCCRNESR